VGICALLNYWLFFFGEIKMRIRRLKKLVRALKALPDEIKNRDASKNTNPTLDIHFKPFTGLSFVGLSFAGLMHIVAQDIPALKKHYTYDEYDIKNGRNKYDSKNGIVLKTSCLYTEDWERALRRYLGVDLADWASSNSVLWGNDKVSYNLGFFSGFSSLAFDMNGSGFLTNRHIINHLICVCNRYKSLSLKDKAVLFIDNQGGFRVVLLLVVLFAYISFATVHYNLLHFMIMWLSITITTAIWNY
jgi:hypothetical protein